MAYSLPILEFNFSLYNTHKNSDDYDDSNDMKFIVIVASTYFKIRYFASILK